MSNNNNLANNNCQLKTLDTNRISAILSLQLATIRTHKLGLIKFENQILEILGEVTDNTILETELLSSDITLLSLMSDGNSPEEIACILNFTIGSVRVMLSKLYAKLGVSSNLAAVAWARRNKIIS